MNPEKFIVQKLDKAEAKRVSLICAQLQEKYPTKIKQIDNGPDVVKITVLNKEGEEVTHGFTKVNDNIAFRGNNIRFSEFIEATIEGICGDGDYEELMKEAVEKQKKRDAENLGGK